MSHGNLKCVVCATLTLQHLGQVGLHGTFQGLNSTHDAHSQVWQYHGSLALRHLLFSPAQELRAGSAAALLVSLNLGKDLKGKDACFQSLKIYYIYYVAKEEGIAL